MKIKWTKQTGRFKNGENLVLGLIPVGSVSWAVVAREEEPGYNWILNLPGKERKGFCTDIVTAKSKLQEALNDWMVSAGILNN